MNKNTINFNNDSDGQFDYMTFLTIIKLSNHEYKFFTTINILVKTMGFKPNSRVGKINDKISKSLDRLCNSYNLIKYDEDGKIIYGEIIEKDDREIAFKVMKEAYDKVIGNTIFNDTLNDNKYTEKAKALYMYNYILASGYENNKLSARDIFENCNMSQELTYKYIKYLHEDGLINGKLIIRTADNLHKPYVYIHINKINGEVLYVGKGRNERYCDLKSRNSKYINFINTIGEENIECKILEYFEDDYAAYIYEYEIANKFRAIGQAKYCIVLGNFEIKDGQQ